MISSEFRIILEALFYLKYKMIDFREIEPIAVNTFTHTYTQTGEFLIYSKISNYLFILLES